MNETVWLTISGIERETGIPNPTLRRYIRTHGHHLHIQKTNKGYMVSSASVPVLLQIRDGYGAGLSTTEMESNLAEPNPAKDETVTEPVRATGEPVRDGEVSGGETGLPILTEEQGIRTDIASDMSAYLRQQIQLELKEVHTQLSSVIESLKSDLAERQQQLIKFADVFAVMHKETEETQRQIAAAMEQTVDCPSDAALSEDGDRHQATLEELKQLLQRDNSAQDRLLMEVLRTLQDLQQQTQKKRRWLWRK